jgi:hypothetical protein
MVRDLTVIQQLLRCCGQGPPHSAREFQNSAFSEMHVDPVNVFIHRVLDAEMSVRRVLW